MSKRNFYLNNSEILIIGGTGSLGKTITKILLTKHNTKGIRIFSRDELKQWEMKQEFKDLIKNKCVSFLIGDVRDRKRLKRAMRNVDVVYNTAAMKQVPACENDPVEAVKTNIGGAVNVIECALDNKVKVVMHVSTDKAVYPINLYGATKTVAEKIFTHANVYNDNGKGTKFSCVRYGNVLGSRGSILPLFKKQYDQDKCITITDNRMTRFWVGLNRVANFIIDFSQVTEGSEIFIPRMHRMKVFDLARALYPDAKTKPIGIRKGEKLHEILITEEESLHVNRFDDFFIINENYNAGSYRWTYSSDQDEDILTKETLERILKEEGLL